MPGQKLILPAVFGLEMIKNARGESSAPWPQTTANSIQATSLSVRGHIIMSSGGYIVPRRADISHCHGDGLALPQVLYLKYSIDNEKFCLTAQTGLLLRWFKSDGIYCVSFSLTSNTVGYTSMHTHWSHVVVEKITTNHFLMASVYLSFSLTSNLKFTVESLRP
jgi:hypothetical protein